MDIPVLSTELIRLLDEAYPPLNITLNMTEKEIMYKAGQRAVVQNLLLSQKIEEETHYV